MEVPAHLPIGNQSASDVANVETSSGSGTNGSTSSKEASAEGPSVTASPTNVPSLKRSQGIIPLTALGVGAVISGDFFGWNFGLDRGGFGGLMIATFLVGTMYVCISLSLAELASMFPSAEGAFAFSRQAFGPYAGFLCGLSESLEYVLLVPVIITGLGDHLNLLFNISNPDVQIAWWCVLCVIYLIFHLWGAQPTFWSNTIITCLSLLTLLLFWCTALAVVAGEGDSGVVSYYPADERRNQSDAELVFKDGAYGVFTCLVFASWFFIAVEELPLAGEDAIEPERTIPRALVSSICILLTTAVLTAWCAVSLPGGTYNIANTGGPLVRSLISGLMNTCVKLNKFGEIACESDSRCEWNEDEETCWDKSGQYTSAATAWEVVINVGTLIGLLTSCHAIIFAGGRQLMSLTRNGCFPKFTRFDRIHNGTPRVALTVDIVVSFFVCLIVYLIGEGVDFLVGLSVAAACVSYIFSMCSFVKLRLDDATKDEKENRVYKSPLGIVGASYAAIMAFMVCISFFVDIAVGLGAVILVVALLAFALIYALLSLEFLRGCCGNKSGLERFNEYESKCKTDGA